MGGSKKQTVGYKYYAGIHMALCHGPVDALLRVEVDEKVVWEGSTGPARITVDKVDLFGGESREGGITGEFDFLDGNEAQTKNDYLMSVLGPDIPAYRGVVSIILRKMYLSMNPYLKTWKFRVKRVNTRTDGVNQWYPEKAEIIATNPLQEGEETPTTISLMNPAHVFYETLTNKKWGAGASFSELEDATFRAAADVFYDEGLGLAMVWDTQKDVWDFLRLVQQHVDAVLTVDRKTGKFKLKAIRKDYDVDTLIHLDPSNVDKIEDPKQLTFGDLANSITINYWDNVTGKTGSVTVSDPALEIEQGVPVNTAITYEGIADAGNAAKIAARELKALSFPLFSCVVYAGSIAKDLEIGDTFLLTWPDYHIQSKVMRVTELAVSDTKSRRVKITCTEDVYDYPTVRYVAPQPTVWVDPKGPPSVGRYPIAEEAPYYALVENYGQATVDSTLASNPYVSQLAGAISPPVNSALNARLYANAGASWEDVAMLDFAPGALLLDAVDRFDTILNLSGGVLLDQVEVNSWLQIGDELMSVEAIAGTVLTVKRGILDTIPTEHDASSNVSFWGQQYSLDTTEYVMGDVVTARHLTVNGSGQLPLSSAASFIVEMDGRAIRPFPPADVKINAAYWPTAPMEEVGLTWTTRNRILQTGGTHIGWYDGAVTPEPGTTYTLRAFDDEDALLFEETGIAALTYTVDTLESATWPLNVRLELVSTRDGHESWQPYVAHIQVLGDNSPILEGEFDSGVDELEGSFDDGDFELFGEL